MRGGSPGHWAQGQACHTGRVASAMVAEACAHCPAAAVGSLLPHLALFAHLVSNTLLQGSATSHVAPVEPADRECCPRQGLRVMTPEQGSEWVGDQGEHGGWVGVRVGKG